MINSYLQKKILDEACLRFNQLDFIQEDPISIPRSFSKKQDIEISAFWTAMLSWGQRKTIINKARELFELMDNSPHDFIVNHEEKDRMAFAEFKHRTFNYTDSLYFLEFLQNWYKENDSLESAFFNNTQEVETALISYHDLFFSLPYAPTRTKKHVSTPKRNSSCKRLNMFLRWMVRSDDNGVDFGIWKSIDPSKLMIPLDVHVHRVASKLELLNRKQSDWQSVLLLTERLREFDAHDPVKYDFALFGLGVLNDL